MTPETHATILRLVKAAVAAHHEGDFELSDALVILLIDRLRQEMIKGRLN